MTRYSPESDPGTESELAMSHEGVPVGDMWGGNDWQAVRPATKSGTASTPIPIIPESQPTPVRPTRAEVVQQMQDEAHQARVAGPKPRGWRAVARKLGLSVAPESVQETRERLLAELARVAVPVGTVKNILIANPKGESGKSTTALTIAAALGVHTGSPSALFDNNPTGNLAERIEDVDQRYTLDDVVANLEVLEDPATQLNAIATFMRYQRTGRFMVLTSRARAVHRVDDGSDDGSVVWADPTLSADVFARVHHLLTRAFQTIVIDSGNNDADLQFRGAVEVASQLVIPLKWSQDSCDKAARLLASLDTAGYSDLADSAIILATHGPGVQMDPERQRTYTRQFEEWGNRVLSLPSDRALVLTRDQRFNWAALAQPTKDAAAALAVEITRTW